MSDAAGEDAAPVLPAHVQEMVQSIVRMHEQHDSEATPLERLTEELTAAIGRPAALLWLALAAIGWSLVNLYGGRLGFAPPDPPPFSGLQLAASLAALGVTVIILTTQRRADKLAGLRAQLTLELAILGEQKTAKVIKLLEELRRDDPLLRDRQDPEAAEMAEPSDPKVVLDALATSPEGPPPD
jgi:uncharacterized membrane protein